MAFDGDIQSPFPFICYFPVRDDARGLGYKSPSPWTPPWILACLSPRDGPKRPQIRSQNVSFLSSIASIMYFGYNNAKVTDTTLFKSRASGTHSSFCQIKGVCPIAFESQPETVVSWSFRGFSSLQWVCWMLSSFIFPTSPSGREWLLFFYRWGNQVSRVLTNRPGSPCSVMGVGSGPVLSVSGPWLHWTQGQTVYIASMPAFKASQSRRACENLSSFSLFILPSVFPTLLNYCKVQRWMLTLNFHTISPLSWLRTVGSSEARGHHASNSNFISPCLYLSAQQRLTS